MSASPPIKPTTRVAHSMQPNRGRLLAWWDAIRGQAATKDEGHKERSFTEKFLHPDYFYNHAEPHRRRPTLVEFPHFITHTATFFGRASNPRTEFRKWLQMLRCSRWRRLSDVQPKSDRAFDIALWSTTKPIPKDVLENFSLIAQPSFKEETDERASEEHPKDVEFVLEFRHQDEPEVVLRIEAHLEFFTLTLFKPLERDKFHLDTIYSDFGHHLVPDEDVSSQNPNPFHALYGQLVRRFPGETFAHFEGVVVGPEFIGSNSELVFAEPGANGPMDSDGALRTAKFLRKQKERFKESVFEANDDDVVACYLQHGQAIYLSALGAQAGPGSKDALRYLVIYNKAGPIDGDLYEPRADRYRLSRLVHRINAIGTLRLAALQDLRELRRVGDQLRRIESEMEIAAHEKPTKSRFLNLRNTISRLENLTRSSIAHGVPPFYRTARSGLYFNQMKKLLAELGPDPIPSWQSYDQFLSRRLFAQLEFTATLGTRISVLWTNAQSRAEVAETLTLDWLRRAAMLGSVILFPLAVSDMSWQHRPVRGLHRYVVEGLSHFPQCKAIKNWLQIDVLSWWHSHGISEFWLVFWIAFFVWGAFIIGSYKVNARSSRTSPSTG